MKVNIKCRGAGHSITVETIGYRGAGTIFYYFLLYQGAGTIFYGAAIAIETILYREAARQKYGWIFVRGY